MQPHDVSTDSVMDYTFSGSERHADVDWYFLGSPTAHYFYFIACDSIDRLHSTSNHVEFETDRNNYRGDFHGVGFHLKGFESDDFLAGERYHSSSSYFYNNDPAFPIGQGLRVDHGEVERWYGRTSNSDRASTDAELLKIYSDVDDYIVPYMVFFSEAPIPQPDLLETVDSLNYEFLHLNGVTGTDANGNPIARPPGPGPTPNPTPNPTPTPDDPNGSFETAQDIGAVSDGTSRSGYIGGSYDYGVDQDDYYSFSVSESGALTIDSGSQLLVKRLYDSSHNLLASSTLGEIDADVTTGEEYYLLISQHQYSSGREEYSLRLIPLLPARSTYRR